jgi:hypothetical protein
MHFIATNPNFWWQIGTLGTGAKGDGIAGGTNLVSVCNADSLFPTSILELSQKEQMSPSEH